MKVVKVGVKEKDVKVVLWDGSLKGLQEMVEGHIEVANVIGFTDHRIKMIVNEEGLLTGLPVNDNLLPFLFVGNAVFLGASDEDFTGLTPDEIDRVLSYLSRTDEP